MNFDFMTIDTSGMRNIRIGVVEDDPASCQRVLDYLNRYQSENDERHSQAMPRPQSSHPKFSEPRLIHSPD